MKALCLLFVFASFTSFAGERMEFSKKYTRNMVSQQDEEGKAANIEANKKAVDEVVKQLEAKCPGIDLLSVSNSVEDSDFQLNKVFMRADASGYCK